MEKPKTPSRLTNWREDAFGKERKVISITKRKIRKGAEGTTYSLASPLVLFIIQENEQKSNA
ncbi:MAG: hypothetical protein KH138_00470 [Firmicutes bacterium]|nr:hypothetical protein [Bacillota bacterium]